jgi:hypothetical protein
VSQVEVAEPLPVLGHQYPSIVDRNNVESDSLVSEVAEPLPRCQYPSIGPGKSESTMIDILYNQYSSDSEGSEYEPNITKMSLRSRPTKLRRSNER